MTNHQQALEILIQEHFKEAKTRIEPVYQAHFASPKAIFKRHWSNKKDIPGDLLVLPRAFLGLGFKLAGRKDSSNYQSGKEKAIRHILENELLDLSGLQKKLDNYCEPFIHAYENQLNVIDGLTQQQRTKIENLIEHKIQQLHLPSEGMREFVLAATIALTGKAIGDKALISSAASLGSTLAGAWYINQQSFFGSLWVSLFGAPAWVSYAGIGSGIVLALLLAPLSAPVIELGVNRMRAHKLLEQTVEQALSDIKKGDSMIALSKLASWLQMLPDIAQAIARL